MSGKKLKSLVKYLISFGICALLGFLYVSGRVEELGAFSTLPRIEQYMLLCDAFTIPGTLMLMCGLLITVSNEGAMDGLSYLGHSVVNSLIPARRKHIQKYGEYVERRRQKRTTGYGFLYIVGAVCMAIALVFLALYSTQG